VELLIGQRYWNRHGLQAAGLIRASAFNGSGS
jgi:hypothetical protein